MSGMKRVSATSAKNRFGEILRMAETEPVYIVKHGKPKTVVIDADQFEALKKGLRHPDDEAIAVLHEEFNALYARMQEPRWRKGVEGVLSASDHELNRISARRVRAGARKPR
jgi:prevent-host-death family protein